MYEILLHKATLQTVTFERKLWLWSNKKQKKEMFLLNLNLQFYFLASWKAKYPLIILAQTLPSIDPYCQVKCQNIQKWSTYLQGWIVFQKAIFSPMLTCLDQNLPQIFPICLCTHNRPGCDPTYFLVLL